MKPIFLLFFIPALLAASVGNPSGFPPSIAAGSSFGMQIPVQLDQDGSILFSLSHDLPNHTLINFTNCAQIGPDFNCTLAAGSRMVNATWTIPAETADANYSYNITARVYQNSAQPPASQTFYGGSGSSGGVSFSAPRPPAKPPAPATPPATIPEPSQSPADQSQPPTNKPQSKPTNPPGSIEPPTKPIAIPEELLKPIEEIGNAQVGHTSIFQLAAGAAPLAFFLLAIFLITIAVPIGLNFLIMVLGWDKKEQKPEEPKEEGQP